MLAMWFHSVLPRPMGNAVESFIDIHLCSSKQCEDMGASTAAIETMHYSVLSQWFHEPLQFSNIDGMNEIL